MFLIFIPFHFGKPICESPESSLLSTINSTFLTFDPMVLNKVQRGRWISPQRWNYSTKSYLPVSSMEISYKGVISHSEVFTSFLTKVIPWAINLLHCWPLLIKMKVLEGSFIMNQQVLRGMQSHSSVHIVDKQLYNI